MTTPRLGDPLDGRVPFIRRILDLDRSWSVSRTGARQTEVERAARAFGDALRAGPKVVSVRTLATSDAPYPVRFAFNGAVPTLAPGAMLVISNRSLLVQVNTEDGPKNVLFNPTDGPANAATPFYERVAKNTPGLFRRAFEPKPNRCAERLAALGLSPADIDVIAFDHFHTQDLRPLLGAPGVPARFPNAYLLAPRAEWEDWDDLPMMQRAWFVPDGKKGVPHDRVVLTDADLSVGEGLALLRTPGHTIGNQTLFAHADRGVFGCSENGTSADNWSPHHSRIRGMKRAAELLGLDVILNANTPELSAEQYTSMLLERAVVDRATENDAFYQMFPSSEVTRSWLAPHIRPTLTFGEITSGGVRPKDRPGSAERRRARGGGRMSAGPVTIVSGAASGIGRHLAKALRREGRRVVATDIDTAGLAALVRENGWEADENVMTSTLDVRNSDGWEKLVTNTVERFGSLDTMLNVAGFLRPGYVHEVDAACFDLHMDINAKGVMYATRAAARQMVQQGSGHIVNFASIAGLSHVPGLAAYAASKHAVRGFTLSVAHELSRHGVAVTVFCPDAVETPMLTLQERYPEAAMTFGGRRALRLEEVESAILRALRQRPLEVVLDVPFTGRAVGAKIANFFPRMTALAVKRILNSGRAAQELRVGRGSDATPPGRNPT